MLLNADRCRKEEKQWNRAITTRSGSRQIGSDFCSAACKRLLGCMQMCTAPPRCLHILAGQDGHPSQILGRMSVCWACSISCCDVNHDRRYRFLGNDWSNRVTRLRSLLKSLSVVLGEWQMLSAKGFEVFCGILELLLSLPGYDFSIITVLRHSREVSQPCGKLFSVVLWWYLNERLPFRISVSSNLAIFWNIKTNH